LLVRNGGMGRDASCDGQWNKASSATGMPIGDVPVKTWKLVRSMMKPGAPQVAFRPLRRVKSLERIDWRQIQRGKRECWRRARRYSSRCAIISSEQSTTTRFETTLWFSRCSVPKAGRGFCPAHGRSWPKRLSAFFFPAALETSGIESFLVGP
jgi:hypothetical protein